MEISSRGKHGTLKIYIAPTEAQKIRIKATDKQRSASVYFDNEFEIDQNTKEIAIPFPLSPNKMLVAFSSEKAIPFQGIEFVKGVRIIPYEFNKELYDWVDDMLTFAKNMPYNKVGLYSKLKLDLADIVRDGQGGKIDTPARTHVKTGKIIASRDLLKDFTIPQVVFTLLHERGHYELKEHYDPNSEAAKHNHEKLADDFAIRLYMALGFPEQEADSVMAKIIPDASRRNGRDKGIDFHSTVLEKLRALKQYREK